MTGKPVLATSFTYREVEALLLLHQRVLSSDIEGALATARRPDMLNLVRKFTSMRTKHNRSGNGDGRESA